MNLPDAYKCKFCGAEYDPREFWELCHSDGTGELEFRCSCGCHEYTELYQCKFCHYLENPLKHDKLEYHRVCNDCLGAIKNVYNDALSMIPEDYRKILDEVYDIRPLKEDE